MIEEPNKNGQRDYDKIVLDILNSICECGHDGYSHWSQTNDMCHKCLCSHFKRERENLNDRRRE